MICDQNQQNAIKRSFFFINFELLLLLTLTLADEAGNVSRTKISNEGGGINRSPFLTAPLTSMVLAFGFDKILIPKNYIKKKRLR